MGIGTCWRIEMIVSHKRNINLVKNEKCYQDVSLGDNIFSLKSHTRVRKHNQKCFRLFAHPLPSVISRQSSEDISSILPAVTVNQVSSCWQFSESLSLQRITGSPSFVSWSSGPCQVFFFQKLIKFIVKKGLWKLKNKGDRFKSSCLYSLIAVFHRKSRCLRSGFILKRFWKLIDCSQTAT